METHFCFIASSLPSLEERNSTHRPAVRFWAGYDEVSGPQSPPVGENPHMQYTIGNYSHHSERHSSASDARTVPKATTTVNSALETHRSFYSKSRVDAIESTLHSVSIILGHDMPAKDAPSR
ncbi:hypothetical protein N7499_009052 [Penicillium canescens]|nr:hypothetical protein N7499_009052 [Penicillium canescens]KAJ6169722.1 hypothetical protein N7485_007068 [Penicillium canescens]